MKEGTHLTVFAQLDRPEEDPRFDYAAFTVIAGPRYSYRFTVAQGGGVKDECSDLHSLFLRHVPIGGDVLTLVTLPMSPGPAHKIAIASAQMALPVLEVPPGRFGQLQLLCASDAVLLAEAHDTELGFLTFVAVLEPQRQVQYLPDRAQLIWLTWLQANLEIPDFPRRAAIAAWQAWRALEDAKGNQPAF